MEKLKFFMEDRAIAELLGRQSFTNKESAVLELIKNSYDAGARSCSIIIFEDEISIIDDGKGMAVEDIKKSWMSVGNSDKKYKDAATGRIQTGSKGIGRFALARLGDHIQMKSKKNENNACLWVTNWENSTVEVTGEKHSTGTSINIKGLRDNWREKDVENLSVYLSRVYKNDIMNISLFFEDKPKNVSYIYSDLEVGTDFVSKININYDSKEMKLKIKVTSDEFIDEVRDIVGSDSFKNFEDEINVLKTIEYDDIESTKSTLENSSEIENLEKFKKTKKEFILENLGDFTAEFYFRLTRTTKDNMKHFMYKYQNYDNSVTGIALYRNDFSIASHEGIKDWIGLDTRARKSPATATHPTGAWRVRSNQLFGAVYIDKLKNKNLIDLANRQGLDENIYYNIFVKIIHMGIKRFEKNRQYTIRLIDKKNSNLIENETTMIDEITNNSKNMEEVVIKLKDPIKYRQLKEEIKYIKSEKISMERSVKEKVKRHVYDTRILNVLATQGLRASSIAHELRNQRNFLKSGYKYVQKALIKYGYWSDLNSPEKTRTISQNVPKILDELNLINIKLVSFLNVMLRKIEKNKFEGNINSINILLLEIKRIWEKEYAWIEINIHVPTEDIKNFKLTDDVIEVILDNLILNSVQKNQNIGKLKIDIETKLLNSELHILYKDNGYGLDEKYEDDPFEILEVHETTRNDGHGLGMWIINNTVQFYDGKIYEITGEDGFSIKLFLKGKTN